MSARLERATWSENSLANSVDDATLQGRTRWSNRGRRQTTVRRRWTPAAGDGLVLLGGVAIGPAVLALNVTSCDVFMFNSLLMGCCLGVLKEQSTPEKKKRDRCWFGDPYSRTQNTHSPRGVPDETHSQGTAKRKRRDESCASAKSKAPTAIRARGYVLPAHTPYKLYILYRSKLVVLSNSLRESAPPPPLHPDHRKSCTTPCRGCGRKTSPKGHLHIIPTSCSRCKPDALQSKTHDQPMCTKTNDNDQQQQTDKPCGYRASLYESHEEPFM